jgi:soluble lytic murein transglycosylase
MLSLHVPASPQPAPPVPALAALAGAVPPDVAQVRSHLARQRTGLVRSEVAALSHTIVEEARRHELPVDLVLAVMHVESRFHAFAVSPVGALGIMQILPATGQELAAQHGVAWSGPQTLFDPEANVRLGVAYLKWLKSRYGSIDVALAAYNWGPGRIDRKLRAGRPVPAGYASDVLAIYRSRPTS